MGGSGIGTNPEQLFAAGWAACFSGALGLVARSQKVDVSDVSVTAEVSLAKGDDGFSLAATLRVELHGEVGRRLVEAAHATCPYSKATRGNIPVELVIE
ncbi:Ohr family peroxiredoxin [Nonomuraea terrae]|uniref:Ohr family peroxiredoxin n=1 Tax=Nonomuraea terrae TaxID=2530383 RepID=UPI003789DEDF